MRATDGRPNGGVRGILIGYITTSNDEASFLREWVLILVTTAATIDRNGYDIDEISLLVGLPPDTAVSLLTVQMDDMRAYLLKEIDLDTLLGRIHVTNF
ncbi:MAG: hypothetical protein KF716_17775 [Anaerolineae bacterium]|nr:hypothetical protein [Anaerolineae bacterium]